VCATALEDGVVGLGLTLASEEFTGA
jgi:hypothetical protein